jgi:hypothetical protein
MAMSQPSDALAKAAVSSMKQPLKRLAVRRTIRRHPHDLRQPVTTQCHPRGNLFIIVTAAEYCHECAGQKLWQTVSHVKSPGVGQRTKMTQHTTQRADIHVNTPIVKDSQCKTRPRHAIRSNQSTHQPDSQQNDQGKCLQPGNFA